MRVLIVAHGHPAFSIGGAEVASHNLFRALGEDAWFLARTAPPVRRHAGTALMSLGQGPREFFLHTEAWEDFWLSNPAQAELEEALDRVLDHVRPDVVHFHHVIGLGVEAIAHVRRRLPHAAVVVTFHEYLAICHNHGQMVKAARRTLCREASPAACHACFPQHGPDRFFARAQVVRDHLMLADAFVSPSRFLVDRHVAWGLPAERFSVIENGLDSAAVPARALAAGGRRDRFGYFGQVSEFKGLPVLLDAVARVPRRVWGEATLCVFGGNLEIQPPAFIARFEEQLAAVGRRVRFFGPYRPDDLPRLMAKIDWTVVPSIWWENSPVVIQEAFLHRRPPIVSDIGGMAEKVTHDGDGLTFRVGSPEDLAEQFSRALTEDGLWAGLSAAAPRPPDLPAFGARHRALYADVLAARAPRVARLRRVRAVAA